MQWYISESELLSSLQFGKEDGWLSAFYSCLIRKVLSNFLTLHMQINNGYILYMLPLLMVSLLPFSMKKNMWLKQNSRNLNENVAVFRPRVPVKHWKITLMFWLAKLNTTTRVESTKNVGNWHLRKLVAFSSLFHSLFPRKCCFYSHLV